jgi:hypothetical protein
MADLLQTTQALADPNAPDLQTLNRQQQYAQALMTQGLQGQPQGQMVSGFYVKPSFTQALAPVVQALTGAYLGNKAETKGKELATALRGKQQEAVQQYMQALQSTPAQEGGIQGPNGQMTTQTTPDMYNADMSLNPAYKQVAPVAAQGPNYNAAFQAATSPYAPAALQAVGYEMLKPKTLKKGEIETTLDFGTGQRKTIGQGAPELPAGLESAQIALNLPVNPATWTPEQRQSATNYEMMMKRAGAGNTVVNMGQHGFENTLKLGENFKSEPIYKTHQEIRQAYNQVNDALSKNNAAGDLAASIKINKLLDPNSVVRESEVATVANATGLLPKLQNYANKVANGVTLNPQQRKEYRDLAKDFYNISGQQYNETRNKYLQVGQQNELKGIDTMLGQPFVAPTSAMPPATKNMIDANAILGIK